MTGAQATVVFGIVGAVTLCASVAAISGIVARGNAAEDNAAIGRAMACIIAKHPGAGYMAEMTTRRLGQRMARQLLADLRAKGATPQLARLSITATVCAGMGDQEPLPLVPE